MSEPVQTVEQLVAAREMRGLSVADVSQQLKLAPRQVQAIEQGDWEALPGPAFTRAVLRGYGRLLGVDVDAIVAGVSGVAESALRPASSLDAPIRPRGVFGFGSGGSGSSLAWVGLVALGLVALALFFGGEGGLSNLRSWIGAPGADGERASAPADAESAGHGDKAAAGTAGGPSARSEGIASSGDSAAGREPARPGAAGKPADSRPSPAAAAGTPAGAASSATPGAMPATGGESAPTPVAAATPQPATAGAAGAQPATTPQAGQAASATVAPSAASQRRVTLRFDRESWIEIRGADDTVLVSGTQKAGTTRTVEFTGRASLVIGNSEYVKVELDDKPFDFRPSSQAGVARFTLP